MYKKVYVEITNNCNLSCSFCIKNKRKTLFITEDNFKIILNKLKKYTKYLYFHVLGEPLLHPRINELINMAYEEGFLINLTTNGYLIDRIKDNSHIRQINISLHSYDESYKVSLNDYLTNIFNAVAFLRKNTYISYRMWVNNPYKDQIINILEAKYNTKIDGYQKIDDNIFIDFDEEFIWPSLDNDFEIKKGTCYALKDHIGILVDGTIIPCCLDTEGIINLGNIYEKTLDEIINSKRYINMLEGFKNHRKIEKLCQKCNFIDN